MMAPPGGQKQSPMKLLYMLPLLFLSNKIDYTDNLVFYLRISYYIVQFATLAVAWFLKQKIESKKDQTKIYLPPVKNAFAPPPENPDEADAPTETTYYQHELDQVNQLFKQTVMGVGMVSLIHFKMGMKPVLLMQSIMGPLNLTDNGLIKKYVLGSKDRVWDESLQGEPAAGTAAAATAALTADGADADADADAADASDEKMEELMDKVWSNEVEPAELLKELTEDNVNFQTSKEGWTPLMALCICEDVKAAQVEKVLTLGADVFITDNDGATAMHWAVMKGALTVVKTLLATLDSEEAAKLLAVSDNEGKTAADLGKESVEDNNDAILELLNKARLVF